MKRLAMAVFAGVAVGFSLFGTPAKADWHHHRYWRGHSYVVPSPYAVNPSYYVNPYTPYPYATYVNPYGSYTYDDDYYPNHSVGRAVGNLLWRLGL